MAISMKAWRVNAKLTQEEMARKMGISRDLYHKIENDKVNCTNIVSRIEVLYYHISKVDF